jgi:hypothetical protein
VPIFGNSEHLFREVVDLLIQLAFEGIRADQSLLFNGFEKFVGFLLGQQQLGGAVVLNLGHRCTLIG